jgi:hypothetical protein
VPDNPTGRFGEIRFGGSLFGAGRITGTGSVAVSAPSVFATGLLRFFGSGNLAISAPTLEASGLSTAVMLFSQEIQLSAIRRGIGAKTFLTLLGGILKATMADCGGSRSDYRHLSWGTSIRRDALRLLGMEELSRQVLKLFITMGTESLDLHTLFEAGGNDPASRQRVLDVVAHLADNGYLESQGSDF